MCDVGEVLNLSTLSGNVGCWVGDLPATYLVYHWELVTKGRIFGNRWWREFGEDWLVGDILPFVKVRLLFLRPL